MPLVKVTAANALKWARFLDEVPRRTRPAVARAINDYGAGVADGTAAALAEQTGLDRDEIRALIEIREATADHLIWEMDATAAAPPPQDWQRPWESRSNKAFEQNNLVNIITSEDEHTCDICDEAAEKGPYTMDEINQIAAKWQHWQPDAGLVGTRTNLLHPNCRCAIVPFRAQRRMSVTFSGRGAPTELLNARQLGIRVAAQMKVAIKAIKL